MPDFNSVCIQMANSTYVTIKLTFPKQNEFIHAKCIVILSFYIGKVAKVSLFVIIIFAWEEMVSGKGLHNYERL